MDLNKKVHFNLGIGYVGANWEEEFTLEELAYNPEHDKDLEAFLEQEWREWAASYIDGRWSFNE
ncbi:DUF7167 family protein [Lysinibacillus parviboronicapiens]|uniref:DUF7167 family protein n=1 Tax=Lysinibacillus parviboronicapiens TaxID=436516 RepID=UPI000D35B82D|nr:hypothetical protein [Lysinibacillus parviboronicapiens]